MSTTKTCIIINTCKSCPLYTTQRLPGLEQLIFEKTPYFFIIRGGTGRLAGPSTITPLLLQLQVIHGHQLISLNSPILLKHIFWMTRQFYKIKNYSLHKNRQLQSSSKTTANRLEHSNHLFLNHCVATFHTTYAMIAGYDPKNSM